MSHSLREQLLGLGYKPAPEPERKKPQANTPGRDRPGLAKGSHADRTREGGKRSDGKGQPPRSGSPRVEARPSPPRRPRSQEDIDLAKAYAIRAQREKDERIEAERLKQEQARLRREAKARLTELLKDKALNDPAAEWVRHFPYGGKIKRVHVTEAQFRALNAGELGVVQDGGRYVVVAAAVLAEAKAIFPDAIALEVDPNAPAADDPYGDPKYQVPDDLIW
ncbi:MAG TPA: DUF2058 family protein [Burkholderiaceae bacterium]